MLAVNDLLMANCGRPLDSIAAELTNIAFGGETDADAVKKAVKRRR